MAAVPAGAFFRERDGLFVGNDAARSPWQDDACHGGPVAGLVARAMEKAVAGKPLVRVTIVYRRPVPIAGIRVGAVVERHGRSVAESRAEVTDGDGRKCAVATGLHIVAGQFGPLPTFTELPPDFENAVPGRFPVQSARHGRPFFGTAVAVAYPPGQAGATGPVTLWMRAPAIVEGESPTPFQLACPVADCGNGISRNTDFGRASFVNPDLTIALHRPPASPWLATQAVSFWEASGVGMAEARLFDREGPVGRALQTLIVRPT